MTCGPIEKEKMSYPIPEPGNRPALGDFLPTVGAVPSQGGYVDEWAAYDDDILPAISAMGLRRWMY